MRVFSFFLTSRQRKRNISLFHLCVFQNSVYSLCHCHFNDLFINPDRSWIYFNKYTAVWQPCIWPHWIFHNIKQHGEEEEGEKKERGVKNNTHRDRTGVTIPLTHMNKGLLLLIRAKCRHSKKGLMTCLFSYKLPLQPRCIVVEVGVAFHCHALDNC